MTADRNTKGWEFEVACRSPLLPGPPVLATPAQFVDAVSMRYEEFLTLDVDRCRCDGAHTQLAGTIADLGYHDSADALAGFTFTLLRWALTCGFDIPDDVYLQLDDVDLSIRKLTESSTST